MNDDGSRTKIFNRLKKKLGNAKAYYIMFKYAKHLLSFKVETFEDLRQYTVFQNDLYTEDYCEKWMYEKEMCEGVLMLLRDLDSARMINLLQIYYEKAQDDPKVIRYYDMLRKSVFGNTSQNEDLAKRLKRVKVIDPEQQEDEDVEAETDIDFDYDDDDEEEGED